MSSSHLLQLLVPTKLEPPQPGATWIPRERLVARLGAAPSTRLTLIVAPAGFGKSTLAAQWLLGRSRAAREVAGAQPAPTAWLTLDEHDQGGHGFLAYVAAAIERAAPGHIEDTLRLLRAPEPPPAYLLIQALLVGMSRLPAGLTLVLDDYHLVTEPVVHQLTAYLLRNLPPRCHLVVLSRVDPPLSLTRLWAERQVTEVRAADLRFTEAEVYALLGNLLGGPPDAALVTALLEQTEGWAIALQLAALAQPGAQVSSYAGGSVGQIAEYLADEVFDRQPPDVQELLLALAVPDRFCVRLCAALLGAPEDPIGAPDELISAESRFDGIVRSNLLLTPIEETGRWFRFHPLFRDLLLRRLRLSAGRRVEQELQLRAAGWLAAEGLAEEAVRLFLAAGDECAAADLIERQLILEAGRDGNNATLSTWLRKLPPQTIAGRPGLALVEAHLAAVHLDLATLADGLANVDRLLAAAAAEGKPPPWPTFCHDLAALRGTLHCWQGQPAAAAAELREALDQGVTRFLTGRSTILLGLATVGASHGPAGPRAFADWLAARYDQRQPEQEVYRYACLAGMHLLAGELRALEQIGKLVAQITAEHQPSDTLAAYLSFCLGVGAYERSDLAAAAAHFGVVVTRKYRINYTTYMSGIIGLALIAAAQGAEEDTASYVQEVATTAGEVNSAFLQHQAFGCLARLALARGDAAAALRAAQLIGADIHLGPSPWLETPRLSQARALIVGGGEAELARAETILAGCLAEVEPWHNVRLQIATMTAQALLRQAQGRGEEALAALARAVGLAAPGGFVRTFVDCGPALEPLLRALAEQGVAPAYLRTVLAAYEPARGEGAHPVKAGVAPPLPEMLTRREAEILALLAERWSDKEIAERLVIAPNTVRKHTGTIYEKLGVSNRRDAVDVARTLGLIAGA